MCHQCSSCAQLLGRGWGAAATTWTLTKVSLHLFISCLTLGPLAFRKVRTPGALTGCSPPPDSRGGVRSAGG